MMRIKNKKGVIDQTVKVMLWLALFILLTAGIYFLLKNIMNF